MADEGGEVVRVHNLQAPAKTTAERDAMLPTSEVALGTLIYNTTTQELNYWNGLTWRTH